MFSVGSLPVMRRLHQYEPPVPETPSPDPPPPDIPEDIVDVIEDILNGDTPPPGVAVDKTDSEITIVTPPDQPPPTPQQTAEIAAKAAQSITLPGGGAPQTQVKYNTDGSITVIVYLDRAARQALERLFLRRVAAAKAQQARGRALLQTSSNTKVNYIVVGANKAQVELYQRQLDKTLSDPVKMSEISNTVIEGSSADGVVEDTTPIISCSYVGHFTISPLYAPCNKYFLSYVYPNCENTDVNFRTRRQLGKKRNRAYWQMLGSYKAPNSTIPTSIEAIERRKCSSKYLQDSDMEVGTTPADWILTPAQKKDDCTLVNIYSVSKKAYLNAPRSCDSLTYVGGDKGRARFRVLHA